MAKDFSKKPRIIETGVRRWYRWHRRIGIISALFVLLLSVTGIILNHTVSLGLHQSHVKAAWVHELYGLPAPTGEEGGFPGLTVDRVILDIHSGRFFGTLGPWVMDAMAVLFIILSVTGVYMWWHRSRELKRKRR